MADNIVDDDGADASFNRSLLQQRSLVSNHNFVQLERAAVDLLVFGCSLPSEESFNHLTCVGFVDDAEFLRGYIVRLTGGMFGEQKELWLSRVEVVTEVALQFLHRWSFDRLVLVALELVTHLSDTFLDEWKSLLSVFEVISPLVAAPLDVHSSPGLVTLHPRDLPFVDFILAVNRMMTCGSIDGVLLVGTIQIPQILSALQMDFVLFGLVEGGGSDAITQLARCLEMSLQSTSSAPQASAARDDSASKDDNPRHEQNPSVLLVHAYLVEDPRAFYDAFCELKANQSLDVKLLVVGGVQGDEANSMVDAWGRLVPFNVDVVGVEEVTLNIMQLPIKEATLMTRLHELLPFTKHAISQLRCIYSLIWTTYANRLSEQVEACRKSLESTARFIDNHAKCARDASLIDEKGKEFDRAGTVALAAINDLTPLHARHLENCTAADEVVVSLQLTLVQLQTKCDVIREQLKHHKRIMTQVAEGFRKQDFKEVMAQIQLLTVPLGVSMVVEGMTAVFEEGAVLKPNFSSRLVTFDASSMDEHASSALHALLKLPEFTVRTIMRVSKASAQLCTWLTSATHLYDACHELASAETEISVTVPKLTEAQKLLEESKTLSSDSQLQLSAARTKFDASNYQADLLRTNFKQNRLHTQHLATHLPLIHAAHDYFERRRQRIHSECQLVEAGVLFLSLWCWRVLERNGQCGWAWDDARTFALEIMNSMSPSLQFLRHLTPRCCFPDLSDTASILRILSPVPIVRATNPTSPSFISNDSLNPHPVTIVSTISEIIKSATCDTTAIFSNPISSLQLHALLLWIHIGRFSVHKGFCMLVTERQHGEESFCSFSFPVPQIQVPEPLTFHVNALTTHSCPHSVVLFSHQLPTVQIMEILADSSLDDLGMATCLMALELSGEVSNETKSAPSSPATLCFPFQSLMDLLITERIAIQLITRDEEASLICATAMAMLRLVKKIEKGLEGNFTFSARCFALLLSPATSPATSTAPTPANQRDNDAILKKLFDFSHSTLQFVDQWILGVAFLSLRSTWTTPSLTLLDSATLSLDSSNSLGLPFDEWISCHLLRLQKPTTSRVRPPTSFLSSQQHQNLLQFSQCSSDAHECVEEILCSTNDMWENWLHRTAEASLKFPGHRARLLGEAERMELLLCLLPHLFFTLTWTHVCAFFELGEVSRHLIPDPGLQPFPLLILNDEDQTKSQMLLDPQLDVRQCHLSRLSDSNVLEQPLNFHLLSSCYTLLHFDDPQRWSLLGAHIAVESTAPPLLLLSTTHASMVPRHFFDECRKWCINPYNHLQLHHLLWDVHLMVAEKDTGTDLLLGAMFSVLSLRQSLFALRRRHSPLWQFQLSLDDLKLMQRSSALLIQRAYSQSENDAGERVERYRPDGNRNSGPESKDLERKSLVVTQLSSQQQVALADFSDLLILHIFLLLEDVVSPLDRVNLFDMLGRGLLGATSGSLSPQLPTSTAPHTAISMTSPLSSHLVTRTLRELDACESSAAKIVLLSHIDARSSNVNVAELGAGHKIAVEAEMADLALHRLHQIFISPTVIPIEMKNGGTAIFSQQSKRTKAFDAATLSTPPIQNRSAPPTSDNFAQWILWREATAMKAQMDVVYAIPSVVPVNELRNPSAWIHAVQVQFALENRISIAHTHFDVHLLNLLPSKPPTHGYYLTGTFHTFPPPPQRPIVRSVRMIRNYVAAQTFIFLLDASFVQLMLVGMVLRGALWDFSRNALRDAYSNTPFTNIPCVWLQPSLQKTVANIPPPSRNYATRDQLDLRVPFSHYMRHAPSTVISSHRKYKCPILPRALNYADGLTNDSCLDFTHDNLTLFFYLNAADEPVEIWAKRRVHLSFQPPASSPSNV